MTSFKAVDCSAREVDDRSREVVDVLHLVPQAITWSWTSRNRSSLVPTSSLLLSSCKTESRTRWRLEGHSAEGGQLLLERIQRALDGGQWRFEHPLLQFLDVLLESIGDRFVIVHRYVDERVDQIGRFIANRSSSSRHRFFASSRIRVHPSWIWMTQRSPANIGDLGRLELAVSLIELMEHQEHVLLVGVQLGALLRTDGVFHRQWMESKFFRRWSPRPGEKTIDVHFGPQQVAGLLAELGDGIETSTFVQPLAAEWQTAISIFRR